ncbi:hypothetical protein ABZW02_25730 [Streptomyces sp. NPDC005180]|uniref:hypothetical protein n=1 Tax=Streptomyces sp. NPDC005180 TaxID=3156868 RepID=UPI0033A4FA4C
MITIIRRTRLARLAARAEAYAQAYQQAQASDTRRRRLLVACATYRAESANLRALHYEQARRIRHLETQLDHALGVDSPAVDAGSNWQQRRADKPYRPTSTAVSGA